MIDVRQFRSYIITPVLKELNMFSTPALDLLTGTALVESGLRYVRQLEGGPARGVYQCEPWVVEDLYKTWLNFRPNVKAAVDSFRSPTPDDIGEQIEANLRYATAIARCIYYRYPDPIPVDIPGQASLWKRRYNSSEGKGTEEKYIETWRSVFPF